MTKPESSARHDHRSRSWVNKFRDAFAGIRHGMRGQSSFLVHVPVAIGVLIAAAVFQVSLERWCLLLICIGVVLSAELFNSSLEYICKSITDEHDPNIGRALDIASGSVLTIALAASTVAIIIFANAVFA